AGLSPGDQAHDREPADALAGSGFPDDAERFPRGEGEGDAVYGLDQAVLGGEMNAQILDFEQRLCHPAPLRPFLSSSVNGRDGMRSPPPAGDESGSSSLMPPA